MARRMPAVRGPVAARGRRASSTTPTLLLSGSTRAQQRLTAGPQYALATPEPLLDVRMLIPARPLCDDGSDGPVLMHSIRVIKYAQLVANDDARAAFRYVPHLI
jgi:hypothetical protein